MLDLVPRVLNPEACLHSVARLGPVNFQAFIYCEELTSSEMSGEHVIQFAGESECQSFVLFILVVDVGSGEIVDDAGCWLSTKGLASNRESDGALTIAFAKVLLALHRAILHSWPSICEGELGNL